MILKVCGEIAIQEGKKEVQEAVLAPLKKKIKNIIKR